MHADNDLFDTEALGDRLHGAVSVTPKLMAEFVATACRRFPSSGLCENTERIRELIQLRAWTDAALALVDLELPFWQVRRIVYDEGEWYCAE